MNRRRPIVLAAIVAAGLAVAGLAVPGPTGGALLLALAVGLVVMTTTVRGALDPRGWTLRILVLAAVAAIGIAKIFGH